MMNREKMMGDYTKTRNVIMSCDNWDQLTVGIKMYNQLNKLHRLPGKYLDKLENLVGLMKIKCKSDSSYDVPQKEDKKINEKSSTYKDFKDAAQSSGSNQLRKIMFLEDEEELDGGESEDKDVLKEINIGTQIEQNHLPYDEAKELATQNVSNLPNYYTDPNYCIIAVENKNGDKKTVRVEKSVYEKSKNSEEQLITDDMEIYHEDLDSNRISDMLRNDFKTKYRRRESPREFEQIRRDRYEKPNFEDLYIDLDSEDEIEEATGASSSGQYSAPLFSNIRKEVYKVGDITKKIPTSKNGIVGKRQTGLPIGKLYSFNEDKEVLEEEEVELDEATTVGGVGGVYDTPGFPASKFMGTAGKKGKAPVKKKQSNDVLKNLGYQKVRVKEKCKRFPYCNQSPEAIEFYNEGRVVKTIKKGNLKIK